jgi:hypothetical protein
MYTSYEVAEERSVKLLTFKLFLGIAVSKECEKLMPPT